MQAWARKRKSTVNPMNVGHSVEIWVSSTLLLSCHLQSLTRVRAHAHTHALFDLKYETAPGSAQRAP